MHASCYLMLRIQISVPIARAKTTPLEEEVVWHRCQRLVWSASRGHLGVSKEEQTFKAEVERENRKAGMGDSRENNYLTCNIHSMGRIKMLSPNPNGLKHGGSLILFPSFLSSCLFLLPKQFVLNMSISYLNPFFIIKSFYESYYYYSRSPSYRLRSLF